MTATPHPRSDLVFEVRSLRKSFGGREILNGIDLVVKPSEVVCLIGPSGSGKSTLLRSMALLDLYDSGEVYLFGRLLGYRETPVGRKPASEREVNESVRNSEWFSSTSSCGRTCRRWRTSAKL